jgi:cadmium resistance protein CadD (predicted permease)
MSWLTSLGWPGPALAHPIVTVTTAVVVFASTNVDDLVVLTFFFLACRAAGRPGRWRVVAGQCAGIAVLVASAAVAALGLFVVPTRWVGLLGLVPLAVGVWKLVAVMRRTADSDIPSSVAASFTGVVGVAVINGADNVALYAPLFRSLEPGEIVVTVAVFAGMIGVWCAAAAWLGFHLGAIAGTWRFSHRLVPLVFIAIGAIILARSAIR